MVLQPEREKDEDIGKNSPMPQQIGKLIPLQKIRKKRTKRIIARVLDNEI